MVLPSIVPLSQNIGIEIQKAMNKHILRSVTYFIFAIVNILVTIIGATYFGLFGAAMGYVTSIVFANGVLMNWYYSRYIGLDMRRYWRKTINVLLPFIITGCVGSLQLVHPVHSLLTFILFGLLYALVYGVIYI
ncbi:Putative membrane protein involved in the export of teichoic acid [Latilactobacillus curvatus]|uniref:polysaccharide biosynthesis C-terminal domain-containing protein n=1 Tax=Latilactobacillus curvatus TaxID=28038 RepID=UPI000A1AB129|nr:polysaccharide biosynthesis C-terminal domain-containing protein [Latilactobacillus curvatus]SMH69103.1 Putative membrane protein involved in the export of teichoic acid [Latilactobacillus curvatus]